MYADRGVMIYSQKMEVLKHLDLQWWEKNFSGFKQIGFPEGHLFPLEAPEQLGNLIQSLLIDLKEMHAEHVISLRNRRVGRQFPSETEGYEVLGLNGTQLEPLINYFSWSLSH